MKRLLHVLFTAVFIETHRVGHMGGETWLLGNINQTGYFRVNYDLHNWRLLIQQLMTNPTVFLSSTTAGPSESSRFIQSVSFKFSFSPFVTILLSPHHFPLHSKCLCCFLAADHLRGQQGRSDRWRLQPGKVCWVCYTTPLETFRESDSCARDPFKTPSNPCRDGWTIQAIIVSCFLFSQ